MNTDHTISAAELASIEHYLLGETTAEERTVFENRIHTDTVWAAKVKEVQLLLNGIETASLRERLDDYHTQIKKNPAHTPGGKLISFPKKIAIAASAALLIAIATWLYVNKGDRYEQLYATYYKPDPGLMSAMGVGDNYLFNKAMLDYKTGNYKKAIDTWTKLKADAAPNDTLNYFLGVAQQADGDNDAALLLLSLMAADTANPFYKDACWYTGLALLKKGKVNEAIPYFEKSGRPESSELINQLK